MMPDNLSATSVSGQYDSYHQEEHVNLQSTTETYVALKLALGNDKWRDVPFYIRTGKRLPTRVTEINVEYKQHPAALFGQAQRQVESNVLTLRIQPDEGISLRMSVKKPGLTMALHPVRMVFTYNGHFKDQSDAYERLILDAIAGDQTLFLRNDEVEASWAYATKVLEDWKQRQVMPEQYSIGSWGPAAADQLLQRDGRAWLSDQIEACPIA
jgi:glucose-6-phosphate 1-dehydrogenase